MNITKNEFDLHTVFEDDLELTNLFEDLKIEPQQEKIFDEFSPDAEGGVLKESFDSASSDVEANLEFVDRGSKTDKKHDKKFFSLEELQDKWSEKNIPKMPAEKQDAPRFGTGSTKTDVLRKKNRIQEVLLEEKFESDTNIESLEKAEIKSYSAEGKTQKDKKTLNVILNIFVYGLSILLIVGATMFAFSNDTDKSLFGYRFYNVLTPSMQPFFNAGDMIFVKLADPSEIKVQDVVTFKPNPRSDAYLTHRVVKLLPADDVNPARMITQGDNNNAADPPMTMDAVIGVHQFTIPFAGKAIMMVRDNFLLMSICIAASLLLLIVLRSYFAAQKQEIKTQALAGQAFSGA